MRKAEGILGIGVRHGMSPKSSVVYLSRVGDFFPDFLWVILMMLLVFAWASF